MRRLLLILALAAVAVLTPATAHDIAGESRIHAFVKPEGDRLHVLLRVPLELLLNLDLPKRGAGYLDLPHVEGQLGEAIAATAKDIEFFEDGRRLALVRGQGADLVALGPLVRVVRARAGVAARAEACARDRCVLEPGLFRCAYRVSDRLGASRLCGRLSCRARTAATGSSWICATSRKITACARSSLSPPPVGSRSIRVGTRRRGPS